jgi:transposase
MNKGNDEMRSVIGIDMSKTKFDALWLKDPATLKVKSKAFSNDRKGFAELLEWIHKHVNRPLSEVHVVMEATSVYHEALAHCLFDHDVAVSVVNPAHVHHFAKSIGATHKTDKADSLVLARYGAMVMPQVWQPEPVAVRELKALLARIAALEADLQRERNRLEKSVFNSPTSIVIDSLHKMIRELDNERERLEKEIDDHIDRHPDLKNDLRLLRSIPGVGPVVSRVMLALIRSRAFIQARECAAFLGVIPRIKQSGTFKGKSMLSKTGPSDIRAKLYMAAIVASQHNPDIKAQKERLLKRGKNKMQALGAAMRKLVHQCFGVLKHQTEYCPQAS